MKEIILALIQITGTAIVAWGGIMTANRLTNYRIEQLEKKVNEHNNIIDKTYKNTQCIEVLFEKISVANNRIKDLEENEKR